MDEMRVVQKVFFVNYTLIRSGSPKDMEMKLSASHLKAWGQSHFRAISPCTSAMLLYINFVLNKFPATSLVHVSGERLQDQWSSGFLIFAQNIDCGYTLEPPRWGRYNEYPEIYVLEQK